MNDLIIKYLCEKYSPEAVIIYGSYADGTADAESDFDALVIGGGAKLHDSSAVGGVTLDVFVYPSGYFDDEYDIEDVIQVYGGSIVLDRTGAAAKLKADVKNYIDALPVKTDAENRESAAWCRKMLVRAARGDAEGHFRRHWLLTDSLMIYCDILKKHYFGPKKSAQGDGERRSTVVRALFERARGQQHRLSRKVGNTPRIYACQQVKQGTIKQVPCLRSY